MLVALRLQLGLPYFFSGLTKIQPDWLGGEPLRFWLSRRTGVPLIGRWFTEEWFVRLASWGRLGFDLLVLPALDQAADAAPGHRRGRGVQPDQQSLVRSGHPAVADDRRRSLFLPPLVRVDHGPRSQTSYEVPPSAFQVPPSNGRRRTEHLRMFQVLVPLRFWLYPGEFIWTLEGLRFSWAMRTADAKAS